MKNPKPIQDYRSTTIRFVSAWALYFALNTQLSSLLAQGTAFTYQGRLEAGGQAYTGFAEFKPTLWDAETGGTQIAINNPTQVIVPVTNGLFVLPLDFGTNFPGADRWLQLEVRTAIGPFTLLSPRQKLTPTPYAITAGSVSGTVSASQLTGPLPSECLAGTYSGAVTFTNPANNFSGNGAGLTGLNASALTSGTVPDARLSPNVALRIGGNTFTGHQTIVSGNVGIGHTNPSQPLHVTGNVLLEKDDGRLILCTPTRNFPGRFGIQFSNNSVAPFFGDGTQPQSFAFFAGWSATRSNDAVLTIHGKALDDWGKCIRLTHDGTNGWVGTDSGALQFAPSGLTALRLVPNVNGAPNVIGGSPRNFVGPDVVGATIAGGGATNYGGLDYTNSVLSNFGVVSGGFHNTIGKSSEGAIIAGGQGNDIRTNAWYSAIGGGYDNNVSDNSPYATITGGFLNDIHVNARYSVICGGSENKIADNSEGATIAGGHANDIGTNSSYSVTCGGYNNNIAAASPYATIVGGYLNDISTNAAHSAIGGGYDNNIGANSRYAVIAGGSLNNIGTYAWYSAIAGGRNNTIAANTECASIGGGRENVIGNSSSYATISGGWANSIGTNSLSGAVGGGYGNTIGDNSWDGTIAGGSLNSIGTNSYYSAIGGGRNNAVSDNAYYAVIPGGQYNFATNYAFAAGRRAKANHTGAFVWGDSTDADIASTNANSVTMRASGGYRLFSNSNATAGVYLAPGGGSWSSMCDRNAKENFAPVDVEAVLAKVVALPIATWNYKSQDPAIRHMGPTAQDFKAAFGLGESDTGITSIDADGVALAAIQGLNRKLESELAALKTELKQHEAENAELKRELAELKRLVEELAK